jgi:hypothetical protein
MLSGERIETVSGKRIEAVSGKCQEYRLILIDTEVSKTTLATRHNLLRVETTIW